FDHGSGLSTITVDASGLVASLSDHPAATVTTRMDGINYYGFETVNIETGPLSDILNVQGTTPGSNGFAPTGPAVTNIVSNAAAGAAGYDRAYVSSSADLDQASSRG